MTLTVGNLTVTELPKYGNNYPTAHFTDGILDRFTLSYFDAKIEGGGTGFDWDVLVLNQDEQSLAVEFIDQSSETAAQFSGEIVIGKSCPGDFDNDGDVDGSDLAVFSADFGRTDCGSGAPCEGDFDGDNDVDGSDLAIFS